MFKRILNHRRPPVAVVLGAGMNADGTPGEATMLRAEAAARLAAEHSEIEFVILSGNGPNADARSLTEARVMADLLIDSGVHKHRVLLEDESIDTIGNAVLVAARYLRFMSPRRLFLVTSPFHRNRARLLFQYTLGPAWTIISVDSGIAANDAERGANEHGGIDWTHRFFSDIKPGDLPAVVAKLQRERPYYATLPWLNAACIRPNKRRHRIWCRLKAATKKAS